MLKKLFRGAVSAFLAAAIAATTCTNALAASSKATYIKDVVISYGETEDEAKNWLTENGYEILDNNLNEGADDLISDKRAVYLGYTTTNDAEEAITDMRLMNMQGGYSVQDYQILLEEQKANIQSFLNDFLIAVNEYRANYSAGQQRAVVAHDMLNLLYDDDSQQYMGDLLLNKIKEEYSDEEWSAMSPEAQSKVGDMTTILMQANSNAVLAIQQLVAMATDSGDSTWLERYDSAKTYDEMLEELMDSENLTINEAENQLAAEYDEDAQKIASKFEDYKTYLEKYTNADISFSSTQEEIDAYQAAHEDFNYTNWFTAGTQYELLAVMTNDDISLLDLITGDDYDVQTTERYLLYPLVSVLTDAQRACLDLLSMYHIVALGINDDEATEKAMEDVDLSSLEGQKNSVYDGVDRTIFSDEVALTNEAIRLQASSGKNAVGGAIDSISVTSFILWGAFGVSALCSVAAWKIGTYLSKIKVKVPVTMEDVSVNVQQAIDDETAAMARYLETGSAADQAAYEVAQAKASLSAADKAMRGVGSTTVEVEKASPWASYFRYASAAMVAVTVIIFAVSIWNTYQDLKEYYNAEFTPIPLHMVDEAVDEYDAKTYTYYDAVTCNREEKNMVTDSTKLLGNYADLNGDVGRQWVALYTTKDKNAGNPLTELKVQYEDSSLPDETYTALSMFGEDTAQNLTNKTAGYTYSDGKSGIYLFYRTDANAFAGSVFSNNSEVLIGMTAAIVVGAAAFFVGMGVEKKRLKGKVSNA